MAHEAEVELLLCPMSPSQASFDSSPSWPVAMVTVPALPGLLPVYPPHRGREIYLEPQPALTPVMAQSQSTPHHLPPCTPLPCCASPTAQLSDLGLSEHVMSLAPTLRTYCSLCPEIPSPSLSSGTPGFYHLAQALSFPGTRPLTWVLPPLQMEAPPGGQAGTSWFPQSCPA